MISGEFWDRLSDIVCYVRGKPSTIPFGGIQLVLCGDFLQLPPIPKQQYKIEAARRCARRDGQDQCRPTSRSRICLPVKAGENAKLEVIQLDQVFRQSCNNFVSVLRYVSLAKQFRRRLGNIVICHSNTLKSTLSNIVQGDSCW